jgi:hypothetical protein
MRHRYSIMAAACVALLAIAVPASAARLFCESRNYQRNYCPAGGQISNARLVQQQSQSSCIQGRTWGWDSNGIWVTQGCSGEFDFRWSREPQPNPGRQLVCESQGFGQRFCPSGRRITRAWLVEQRSQSACIQGRTWGFQDSGIWVSSGCAGVFGVEGGGPAPPPPPINRIVCQSRDYNQAFCPSGTPIARAWLVDQRSDAACIQGQTWGWQRNGIWVDKGCSGSFSFEPR